MKIVLENLTKIFPNRNKKLKQDVVAVSDFTFTIPDGKLIGLLGPSGCGKSTTLYMISGLYKKDIVGKKISLRLEDKISKRSTIVVNKTDKIEICDNVELKKPSIIKPINVYGDIIGCVVVSSDKDITDVDKSLAEFSGVFMSRYLEG